MSKNGINNAINISPNFEDKRKYLKTHEKRIIGSCDICKKQSSKNNRTCNKCFAILIKIKNTIEEK